MRIFAVQERHWHSLALLGSRQPGLTCIGTIIDELTSGTCMLSDVRRTPSHAAREWLKRKSPSSKAPALQATGTSTLRCVRVLLGASLAGAAA